MKNPNNFPLNMGKKFTGVFTLFLPLTSVHWIKKEN